VIALGAVIWILLAAPEPDTDAIAEARRAIYQRGGYQATIPSAETSETEGVRPSAGSHDVPPPRPPPRSRSPRRDPVTATEIGHVLLWVFGTVLGALALLWIAGLVRERRRTSAATAPVAAPVTAPPETAPAPRSDAEKLAELGDFAGAVHALLLGALELHRGRLPPSWTSREAARALGREGLTRLVGLVERSWFGGRPATREDYAQAVSWAAASRDEADA